MAFDYEELVKSIVSSIEGYSNHSFTHYERHKWIDSDLFPQALKGSGFSVFVATNGEYEEGVSKADSQININIQFALDGIHDNYLKVLGHCQSAIIELEDIHCGDFKINQISPYFVCEVEDFNVIRVEFEDVIIITSNR